MNHDIRLRSGRSLLYGACVALAGLVGAVLWSPWWLLLLPIGVPSIFRLERNVARSKLAELERCGVPIVDRHSHFYGIAHGRLCRGAVTAPDLTCFEQGAGVPVEIAPGTAVGRRIKAAREWMTWWSVAIDDIDRIESNSEGTTIRFVLRDRTEEIACPLTAERDAVLEILRPARPWVVAKESRRVFRIDPRSWILCLPLVLFSATVFLTSIGLVQPQQLPLIDWKDVKGVRGKGRGLAMVGVMASHAYRFVVERFPPLAAGILGGIAAVVIGIVLVMVQWKTVSDTTWTSPRPTADES